MVSNIDFESHSGKKLEVHINGVRDKCHRCTSFPIVDYAAIFHDLGKMNPNFQDKLNGIHNGNYTSHSYLSVIIFFDFLRQNEKLCFNIFHCVSNDDFRIKILQCIAIISHHHGDLPNFDEILNKNELILALNCASQNDIPASLFLSQKLFFQHTAFVHDYNEIKFRNICNYVPSIHKKIWEKDALNYYMDCQFAFSSLIYSDKRDASNNEYYKFNETIAKNKKSIEVSLNKTFSRLNKIANQSELNNLRTKIRNEAVDNLTAEINKGKRVFTLTAPTGAGKTFALLSLACRIQQMKGKYGIIYALPFLSITEQVQSILDHLGIEYLAVDSKSQNKKTDQINLLYELDPSPENMKKILQNNFFEETFDHPFIITTFVQFFETLISNHNSTLLKLPNFAKRIFLIDEVQALPPRLYIFFSAWLQTFCQKNDSYVILSTATMPKFDFPKNKSFIDSEKAPQNLFKKYMDNLPVELSNSQSYFSSKVFNRYKISLIGDEKFNIEDLANHISKQQQSCLIILNTISETKQLYSLLKANENVILLNTHFTPEDRKRKIEQAQKFLDKKGKIILISTQLIEAGVDIDFPIVYRDFCPLPNLIQSAGRCNRNKNIAFGRVYFFELKKVHGRPSSEIIYNKEASIFLNFCKENITGTVEEKDLYNIQSKFFDYIKDNLSIGDFEYDNGQKSNMIQCINNAKFETLGKFKLIREDIFGEQYRYYIPIDKNDKSYDDLVELMNKQLPSNSYEEKKLCKIKLEQKLRVMSNRIINVRINKWQSEIAPSYSNEKEYFGIRVLSDLGDYSSDTGISLTTDNLFI